MKKYFAVGLAVLVIMPVVAIGIAYAAGSFQVRNLPVYGEVPGFELTERSGQPLSSKALQGKVWIASFIFTRCSGQCPLICAELKDVQRRFHLKDKFRMVSFSVDPERDTPDSLAAYADRFKADPYKWFFVTGNKNSVQSLVQHGFRLAAEGIATGTPGEDVYHSYKLVLVDPNGKIRGYYDATDSGDVKTLIKDTKFLIRQAG